MEVSLKKIGSRYTLTFDRRLAHPPRKVWRALTERDLLRRWFPCDVEGQWKVGSPLRFTFLHGEGEGLSEEDLRGEVLTVDPPRLLEYRWGGSLLRCELVPDGDGCRLLFSETLPDATWGARNAAGWEMCLENLESVFEGSTVAQFPANVWREKFDRYVRKFEPAFGPQQTPPDESRLTEDREV